MISFRFHLVSLIAVFLALGLGVIAGTTVINRAIVSQLEEQTDDLAAQLEDNRNAVAELQALVDRSSRFAQEAMAHLVDGTLVQERLVVLTEDDTDPDAITSAQGALADARAEVVALLALDDSIQTLTEAQRAELAGTLGFETDGDLEDFADQVASALADRLAFGAEAGQPDVLVELIEQGYLVNEGPPLDDAGLRGLDADGFVVVGGGAALEPSPVLVPLAEALADAGTRVAAVEAVDAVQPFVEELRGGPAADSLATQDNVDEVFGQVGLVLALDDLFDGGEPGHYGVKDGATSVIPPAA